MMVQGGGGRDMWGVHSSTSIETMTIVVQVGYEEVQTEAGNSAGTDSM